MEANFERRTPSSVTPVIFEPELELLGSSVSPMKPAEAKKEVSVSLEPPLATARRLVATPELEVEVLRLLNQAGADMGEQLNVTRTPEGKLEVQGIVETDKRKEEILAALAPVANNPAVRVEIDTVAEALKRRPQTQASTGSVVVERSETTATSVPVDADVRKYLASKGVSDERMDEEIRQFASQTLGHSRQALRHAIAMRRLAQRFSPEDLNALDRDARAKWLAIIRQHSEALRQEVAALRHELNPIFAGAYPYDAGEQIEIRNDADLMRGAERLYAVCSANDRVISSAFAVSPDTSNSRATAVRSLQFWRSLRSAESWAVTIASFR